MYCGSCWTFSCTGAIEGNYQISQGGKPISLSEQQIVDCASEAGYGCYGGSPNIAIQYANQNGLESEANYPYTSGMTDLNGVCGYNATLATIKPAGYYYCTNSPGEGEAARECTLNVYQALLGTGPISVVMEADSNTFQFYESGVLVFGQCDCINGPDHAVIAVGWGYDTASGLTYVLVRNSWGTSWGENGYFRVSYTPSTDTCFITANAYLPHF